MIRFIAAIDSKQGMADDHGIPWQGKLPTDVQYFRAKTSSDMVLMGFGTYIELKEPLSERRNLVATTKPGELRQGFEAVHDARKFLIEAQEDVWVIGGAVLFTATIDLADELYLTQLEDDFRCTKFFPEFKHDFELMSESEPHTENDITYTFQVWRRRS